MLCNNNNTASTVSHASYPSEIDPPKAAAAVGFRLLASGALMSVQSALCKLPLPLKVVVTRTLDLGEVIIVSGSTGTVVSQDASTGVLTLLMDAHLRGWGNIVLLSPFDTDDILDAFHFFLL
jgi:hypothetical protein